MANNINFLKFTRESEWARIQATAATKTLLLGQLKMATHNLYTLMYKHLQRRIPANDMDNTMLQLDKVRKYMYTMS
jgi:hypothetical protein